jgi:hypothetical protein
LGSRLCGAGAALECEYQLRPCCRIAAFARSIGYGVGHVWLRVDCEAICAIALDCGRDIGLDNLLDRDGTDLGQLRPVDRWLSAPSCIFWPASIRHGSDNAAVV